MQTIFCSGRSPAQIYIHIWSSEVLRNELVDSIVSKLHQLLEILYASASESELFLMSIQPFYVGNQIITGREEFCGFRENLASEFRAEYFDVFTPLSDVPPEGLLKGNEVSKKGHFMIAHMLSRKTRLHPVPIMFPSRETTFTGCGNKGETLASLTMSPEKDLCLCNVMGVNLFVPGSKDMTGHKVAGFTIRQSRLGKLLPFGIACHQTHFQRCRNLLFLTIIVTKLHHSIKQKACCNSSRKRKIFGFPCDKIYE